MGCGATLTLERLRLTLTFGIELARKCAPQERARVRILSSEIRVQDESERQLWLYAEGHVDVNVSGSQLFAAAWMRGGALRLKSVNVSLDEGIAEQSAIQSSQNASLQIQDCFLRLADGHTGIYALHTNLTLTDVVIIGGNVGVRTGRGSHLTAKGLVVRYASTGLAFSGSEAGVDLDEVILTFNTNDYRDLGDRKDFGKDFGPTVHLESNRSSILGVLFYYMVWIGLMGLLMYHCKNKCVCLQWILVVVGWLLFALMALAFFVTLRRSHQAAEEWSVCKHPQAYCGVESITHLMEIILLIACGYGAVEFTRQYRTHMAGLDLLEEVKQSREINEKRDALKQMLDNKDLRSEMQKLHFGLFQARLHSNRLEMQSAFNAMKASAGDEAARLAEWFVSRCQLYAEEGRGRRFQALTQLPPKTPQELVQE